MRIACSTQALRIPSGVPGLRLANRQLGWSRARWNVITLGGGIGALLGAGTGILTDAWKDDGRAGFRPASL